MCAHVENQKEVLYIEQVYRNHTLLKYTNVWKFCFKYCTKDVDFKILKQKCVYSEPTNYQ